ncbi:MAG: polyhydroxyalkanoate synthesis repressor PhaR [Pseudomonadota bacterium]
MTDNAPPTIIKKYSNRRLYNTETSSYIVLTDVIALIEEGVDFRIEDAKTGEDLTRSVLNQIIFEKETQSGAFFFPLDFQKQLIRFYNDAYAGMVPDYLAQSMAFFTEQRNGMTESMQSMMAENTKAFMDASQQLAEQNVEMMRIAWAAFLPDQSQGSVPEKSAEESRLEALQAQVDALQDELKKLRDTDDG